NPDEFEKYKNGISDSNAWSLFQNDTKNAVDDVRRRIKVPLNQNQFDVMVSQAFNLGDGNFRDTGIPAAVNRGATNEELQKLFMGAIKSKDEVVPGLKNRRSVEWKNYIK
ncbi:MAG: lysozyme, partial [Rickettsiales bacterium]|nr:lysozyme [Rickettsiales bacterium]